MKTRVLLYAAKFMNIYQDIIDCLENMNMEVVWVEANTIPNNPFNKTLGLYNQKNIDDYMSKAADKWQLLMKEDRLQQPFDYFISIVGIDIPLFIFEELRKLNPEIRMALYLYDRVEGVYQIDGFFKYYDEVFSFDRSDCRQFKLSFLPIFWVPIKETGKFEEYDIFAFASYSTLKQERTLLFSRLKRIASKNKYKDFIKLYDSSYANDKIGFIARNVIKTLIGRNTLTIKDICKGLITGRSVNPSEYRQLINHSKVVFDTQASYQDGLTARFMWALGAGKKIITTNPYSSQYEFYDKNQVLILDDNYELIDEFLHTPYEQSESHKNLVEPYRIDNWIKTIMSNK